MAGSLARLTSSIPVAGAFRLFWSRSFFSGVVWCGSRYPSVYLMLGVHTPFKTLRRTNLETARWGTTNKTSRLHGGARRWIFETAELKHRRPMVAARPSRSIKLHIITHQVMNSSNSQLLTHQCYFANNSFVAAQSISQRIPKSFSFLQGNGGSTWSTWFPDTLPQSVWQHATVSRLHLVLKNLLSFDAWRLRKEGTSGTHGNIRPRVRQTACATVIVPVAGSHIDETA